MSGLWGSERENGGGGGGDVTVVDNLSSTSSTDALSANQGRALDVAKAPLASPTFTGTPEAPTASGGTDTTQLATTAFTRAEILSRVLTSLSTASSTDVTASDTVLSAFGKLQAKWNAIAATVRGTALTGLSVATTTDVVATDTILVAIGKLQGQIDNIEVGGASVQDSLTPGSATVAPSVDAVVDGLATKKTDLAPVAITTSIDCTTDLGDGSTHANRQLYSTGNGDVTVAVSGGADGDAIEHTPEGTGSKTHTGVTVPTGCTAVVGQNQVFTAIRRGGTWRSTTPDYAAIANAGQAAAVPFTVTSDGTAVGDVATVTVEAGWVLTGRQWTRGGVDISGSTGATHTFVNDDAGEEITCTFDNLPYVPTGITVDAAPDIVLPTLTYRTHVTASGAATVSDSAFTPAAGELVIVVASFIDDNNATHLQGSDITIDDVGGVLTWTNAVTTPDGAEYSHGQRVAWAVGTGVAITPRATVPSTCFRVGLQAIIRNAGGDNSVPIGGVGSFSDSDADGAVSITLNATPVATSTTITSFVSTMQFGTPSVAPSSGWTERWEAVFSGWGVMYGMSKDAHTSATVPIDDMIEDASGAGGLEGLGVAFEVKGVAA